VNDTSSTSFKARVRRAYSIEKQQVLILERYEGDVEVGEWVAVDRPDGTRAIARIASLAWGSAFRADDPPLTLVVEGLKGYEPIGGSEVIGVPAPSTAPKPN
jgi:hypothetical protein